jgi:uncharacterized membrane protein
VWSKIADKEKNINIDGGKKMLNINYSIVIERPLEEVFAYVTDIENMPVWSSEVEKARKTSEGPMGIGTTFSSTAKILGRQIENTIEVTEYEPNSKWSLKPTSGPVSGEIEYHFEPVNGDTKFSVSLDADSGGLFKLGEPIVNRMLQRQYETNGATLKDLLEAQAEVKA